MPVLGAAIPPEGRTRLDVLRTYLRTGYRAGERLRLTTRAVTATGQEIAEWLVSRLEVVSAMSMIPSVNQLAVELWCIEDKPRRYVARRLAVSEYHAIKAALDGLDVMADAIFEPSEKEKRA